jgi:hypothetical protein
MSDGLWYTCPYFLTPLWVVHTTMLVSVTWGTQGGGRNTWGVRVLCGVHGMATHA